MFLLVLSLRFLLSKKLVTIKLFLLLIFRCAKILAIIALLTSIRVSARDSRTVICRNSSTLPVQSRAVLTGLPVQKFVLPAKNLLSSSWIKQFS